MRFEQLDVVHREVCRLGVHAEYRIAPVAEIAHRHVESPRIGTGGAEQDGLLRPAAGSPHAPELENPNRSVHEVAAIRGARTARCGARETTASARPKS